MLKEGVKMVKNKYLQLRPQNPLKVSNLLKIAFVYLLALGVFGFGQGVAIFPAAETSQKEARR